MSIGRVNSYERQGFYQDEPGDGTCNIRCHGTYSIYNAAYDAISKSG